ncbi:hypothetical protein V6N13_063543 [Hibiscus sabdariffa]
MNAMAGMEMHVIRVDLITYFELINCCLARNAIEQGRLIHKHVSSNGYQPKTFLLNIMVNIEGVLPNMFTFSSVLRACKYGIIKVELEYYVFVKSSLIFVYSKLDKLRDVVYIFKEIETMDLVGWNSIIEGLMQNSDGGEALNQFKRMEKVGFAVDQALNQ